uniref:hypothetical protein n=1 Tax=Fulvivirga sp. TaxID=1931237 RepID=UPI004049A689
MEHLSASKLLILILSCAAFNTGLIWLVQLVHYPSFLYSTAESFPSYHQFHTRAISVIVAPSMGLELLTSLVYLAIVQKIEPLYWLSILFLGLVWMVTFFVAVPLHNSLAGNFDAVQIQKLININWWRTAGWSLRTLILGYLCVRLI